MSDINAYLETKPKQWAAQKQERFEQRVLRDLLRHLEDKPGLAKHLIDEAGEAFGSAWFARNFPTFPVRLSTYKSGKPIAIQRLLKHPDRLPIFKELEELAANYPLDEWGLIFASDGDGLPEMVVHTRVDWDVPIDHWRLILPEASMWLNKGDDIIKRKWVVDPLMGFAGGVLSYTNWRLTEGNLGGEI